mmetsp:Transcript_13634/g.29625  ORF Transcript_13634/g.29625 Transcript_13634/m.29625 type:complete len:401 (-) Transcript_13634:56-1258(-)
MVVALRYHGDRGGRGRRRRCFPSSPILLLITIALVVVTSTIVVTILLRDYHRLTLLPSESLSSGPPPPVHRLVEIPQGREWSGTDLNRGFVSDATLPLLGIITLNARRNEVVNNDNSTKNSSEHQWLYEMSYMNKKRYCDRWDYDLIIENDDVIDRERNSRWGKLLAIKKWLGAYQWLLWIDIDTLIMRFDLPLHDLLDNSYDVIVAKDWNGLNSGVAFFRNSPYTHDLLNQVYHTPEGHLSRFKDDQGGLRAVLDPLKNRQAAIHQSHFLFVPQREINAYPGDIAVDGSNKRHAESQYQPGDRIAHFPSCKYRETCRQTMVELYESSLVDAGLDVSTNEMKALGVPTVFRPANREHLTGKIRLDSPGDVWLPVPVERESSFLGRPKNNLKRHWLEEAPV